jgi:hypothetical protein
MKRAYVRLSLLGLPAPVKAAYKTLSDHCDRVGIGAGREFAKTPYPDVENVISDLVADYHELATACRNDLPGTYKV